MPPSSLPGPTDTFGRRFEPGAIVRVTATGYGAALWMCQGDWVVTKLGPRRARIAPARVHHATAAGLDRPAVRPAVDDGYETSVSYECLTVVAAARTIRQGRYRHFKGGEYRVIGIARVEASPDQLVVVYRSLDNDQFWTRPLESFAGTVEHGGRTVQRFERTGAAPDPARRPPTPGP